MAGRCVIIANCVRSVAASARVHARARARLFVPALINNDKLPLINYIPYDYNELQKLIKNPIPNRCSGVKGLGEGGGGLGG